ncbi:MAG: ATP-dependent metallopeptidase FtsH/Yme1/Tma family protein, partial [Byssovorax sp.]
MSIAVLVLLLSSIFSTPGTRAVPYTEGVGLVQSDRVEKAVVTQEEVVLVQKAEEGKKAEQVRVTRLPGVPDEPLVKALLERNVPIQAQSTSTPIWLQALFWIVPFVLLNALFFYALRRMGQAPAGGPLGFLKSRARVYDRSKQDPVHFGDVAGVDEA